MTHDKIGPFFARRVAAWAHRDVAALIKDYADDCVVESPTSGVLRGRAAVEAIYRHWFSAFPDIVFEQHDVLSMDSRAAEVVTLHGTDTGGFLGQAPTHKPFRFDCVVMWEFVDGRVVREQRVYDLHGVMMQLAIDPALGQTPAEEYQTTLERRRMAEELRVAANIQRLLLPHAQHRGDGFELAATSIPCRAIGGDFFDYLQLPDGSFGFALGDVAGKGPPAALLAAKLQGALAASSQTAGSAAETIQCVNQLLVRRTLESRFVTLVYGVLSRDGRLTYCNAGHNPPVLVGVQGVRRLTTGGLIVGAFQGAAFQEETVQLDSGDVLIAFSDGLTEAFNVEGVEFGEQRLLLCVQRHAAQSPSVLLERVMDAVREFRGGAEQSDDLTAVVLRFGGAVSVAEQGEGLGTGVI